MFLKNGFNLLCLLLAFSMATGCNFLGNDDTFDEDFEYTDAELLSWKLAYDSLPELSTVVFSINQVTSEIYNKDSMSFGTEERLREIYAHLAGEDVTLPDDAKIVLKAIVTYSSGSGLDNVLNITPNDTTGVADSTWVASGDSIEFTRPLKLRTYAYDGQTIKEYSVKLNIHQVDPDSVVYNKIGNFPSLLNYDETKSVNYKCKFYTYSKTASTVSLFSSSDCAVWTPETLSGLPSDIKIGSIVGYSDSLFACSASGDLYSTTATANVWQKIVVPRKVHSISGFLLSSATQEEGVSLVVEKDGKLIHAFLSGSQWTEGDAIAGNFPVKDFSSLSYEKNKITHLTVVAGESQSGDALNQVWSTLDGKYWAKLTSEPAFVFPVLTRPNAFIYADSLWLINGESRDAGIYLKVWGSKDGGVTWSEKAEKYQAPPEYAAREGASVVVDCEGKYFYIIGGKGSYSLPEIWKCYLNKRTFDDI